GASANTTRSPAGGRRSPSAGASRCARPSAPTSSQPVVTTRLRRSSKACGTLCNTLFHCKENFMNKQDLEIWFQRKCAELVGTNVYANTNWALPLMRSVEMGELPGHLVDEMPWSEDDIREAYDKLSYTQIELPSKGCELLGEGWEFSGGWNELYRSQER